MVQLLRSAEAEKVGKIIEERLLEALSGNRPPSDYAPLAIEARENGALIGGLAGGTSYGWLLVKALWVSEAARGKGIGAKLMAEAEEMARDRGCHGAWLDTSSARAELFYARLGYERFGVLENGPGDEPQGHRRVFMRKALRG